MASANLKIDRHCAYCLKYLPSGKAKKCGQCKKRAYCSKECQAADWKQTPGSQGHKNWCQLNCGEEDIDWEIREIQAKGVGVIAKHLIPARSRIMVEALRKSDHPAIMDLKPLNGTLEDKINYNNIGSRGYDQINICLRLARMSHDCDPNAGHTYDFTHDVQIVFAERDIHQGEEITISYTDYKYIIRDYPTANESRNFLEKNCGIICKEGCMCRNKDIEKAIRKCRLMYRQIEKQMAGLTARDMVIAMMDMMTLIKQQELFKAPLLEEARLLYEAFQIGATRTVMLEDAIDYLKRAYELKASYLHPDSKEVLDIKRYVDNPSTYQYYLMTDSSSESEPEHWSYYESDDSSDEE